MSIHYTKRPVADNLGDETDNWGVFKHVSEGDETWIDQIAVVSTETLANKLIEALRERPTPKVIVFVEGGVVSAARADRDVDFSVCDCDVDDKEEEVEYRQKLEEYEALTHAIY